MHKIIGKKQGVERRHLCIDCIWLNRKNLYCNNVKAEGYIWPRINYKIISYEELMKPINRKHADSSGISCPYFVEGREGRSFDD